MIHMLWSMTYDLKIVFWNILLGCLIDNLYIKGLSIGRPLPSVFSVITRRLSIFDNLFILQHLKKNSFMDLNSY